MTLHGASSPPSAASCPMTCCCCSSAAQYCVMHLLAPHCRCRSGGGIPRRRAAAAHLPQPATATACRSPAGNMFLAVYGFMPARATLFSDALKPLFEFVAGPHNTARRVSPCSFRSSAQMLLQMLVLRGTWLLTLPQVRWNPFGRFVARGGFGNLPGDVEIFDKKADNKCKPIVEACQPTALVSAACAYCIDSALHTDEAWHGCLLVALLLRRVVVCRMRGSCG